MKTGATIYMTQKEYEAIEAALDEVNGNYEGAGDEEYIKFWDENMVHVRKVLDKYNGLRRK
jgi:hypothetical protein